MLETLWKTINKLFNAEESGIKVVGNHWFARYSNAFEDREGEFFPVKAIDQYIDRVYHGVVPMPDLWVWHTPVVIGKTKALARIGYFVVAGGTFNEDQLGQAAKAYLTQKKGKNSHGFVFDVESFKDHAYNDYNTFEITVLPFGKGVEANAYTNIEVKTMAMNEEKKRFFVEMFGKETAEELIANTEKASKALEEVGVRFKDFTHISDLKASSETMDDDEETMNGDNMPPQDDEEEKAFKSLVADNTAAIAEIAQGQVDVLKALKTITAKLDANEKAHKAALDAQKNLQDQALAELRAENKALRDELELSPRGTRASQSDDTEVNNKDLADKLKGKETGEKDKFWDFAKIKE